MGSAGKWLEVEEEPAPLTLFPKVVASASLFLSAVLLHLDPFIPALVWPLLFSDLSESLAPPGTLTILILFVGAYNIPISSIVPLLRPLMQEASATTLKVDIIVSLCLYGLGLALLTTSHEWWSVILSRILTGVAAAGLYAALPVAAENMAQLQSGQVTAETVLPWNLSNVTAVNTSRILVALSTVLMSIGYQWRDIIAATIPICLVALVCGMMLPTAGRKGAILPDDEVDANLPAATAFISLQLFVVTLSVLPWTDLLTHSILRWEVVLGGCLTFALVLFVYELPREGTTVLNRYIGFESLASFCQGALFAILIHFGVWFSQASVTITGTYTSAFLASVVFWLLGYHCAAFPVAFPSVKQYLSDQDIVVVGGCVALFGSIMTMHHASESDPLQVSFWMGVCGLGVGMLDLHLFTAPAFNMARKRSRTLVLHRLERSDVVGLTQSLSWNHFGRLVGVCLANRVFVRSFGVFVHEALDGDRISTEIVGLVDAKKALAPTEYLIPDIFPGIPAMYRPPILRAMALALATAIVMAVGVILSSFVVCRRNEFFDHTSEVNLAGCLAVLPDIDDELPSTLTAVVLDQQSEKCGYSSQRDSFEGEEYEDGSWC